MSAIHSPASLRLVARVSGQTTELGDVLSRLRSRELEPAVVEFSLVAMEVEVER